MLYDMVNRRKCFSFICSLEAGKTKQNSDTGEHDWIFSHYQNQNNWLEKVMHGNYIKQIFSLYPFTTKIFWWNKNGSQILINVKRRLKKKNTLWFINPLLVSISILWKYQKTTGFLMFSEATQRGQWHEMGLLRKVIINVSNCTVKDNDKVLF